MHRRVSNETGYATPLPKMREAPACNPRSFDPRPTEQEYSAPVVRAGTRSHIQRDADSEYE